MNPQSRMRGVLGLPILLGMALWIFLALASFAPRVPLGIIEILFLLGPWVVVPLGGDLIRDAGASKSNDVRDWALFLAALLTTVSFFLDSRSAAAWFAGAWLLVCAAFAGDGLRRLALAGTKSFAQFCFAVGEGYLLVAGIWLVASRAGVRPLAFQEPIVLLTAGHFHFAGFASSVLAGLVDRAYVGHRGHRLLRVALLAVILGPGILGLAFLLGPKVKLVAALLIAAGQLGLASGTLRIGIAAKSSGGRWLLFMA